MSKAETIRWVLQHPSKAKQHSQQLTDFLNGVHLQGQFGLAEAHGVGVMYRLPENLELRESFQRTIPGEAKARKILAEAKAVWVRVRESFWGREFDRLLGVPGGARLRVKAD